MNSECLVLEPMAQEAMSYEELLYEINQLLMLAEIDNDTQLILLDQPNSNA